MGASSSSQEPPDYTERQFRRAIAECSRHMAIIRLERATDASANEHSSTRRALDRIVREIPPSFRSDPAYLTVADEMTRELNILPPDPITYTVVKLA
jgi:hypothetical protein